MTDNIDPIQAAIKQALQTTAPERTDLDWDMPLSAAAGLDSVQIMNLVMEIEDALDISVPMDVLADAHTLNDLAGALAALISTPPGDNAA